ncbi:ABC transporter ATP-binding protein [Metasolibacillus meyeri]|uniref:ABC transporter ATP-binding protein n=1 Tax=Metasolibacillus meyeri TaxID=1071052 RepID=UPI000D302B74|nr:ABC transporter ATP-binding protein [Metasolibacillus meyeri]
MSAFEINEVAVKYTSKWIIEDLTIAIPKGKITTILGPNGCGKSTLLKAISRILLAQGGQVYIDGKAIQALATKEIAKRLAILPQTATAPEGITVFELVSYGRFPYQSTFGKLQQQDYDYIHWAIEVTNLTAFSSCAIDELSGGQRQRVWIAMALAQGTDILVLDEPTTYLDMAHQLDILLLLQKLNLEGKTIVMVLHDLNHASRFSDFLIAMKAGNLITSGTPQQVMTKANLQKIFQIDAVLTLCPFSENPICLSYQSSKENDNCSWDKGG